MPKKVLNEGIISKFMDKFFDSIKNRSSDNLIKQMKKKNPKIANDMQKMKDLNDNILKILRNMK